MKKYFNQILTVSFILLFSTGLFYSCHENLQLQKNQYPVYDPNEIISAEENLWKIFKNGDVEQMMSILDTNFTAFSSSIKERLNGKDDEKNHLTVFFEDLKGRLLKWEIISPRVQQFSEVGILTYRFSVTVSILGDTILYSGKQTSVWRNKNSKWYQVHYQYCYDQPEK